MKNLSHFHLQNSCALVTGASSGLGVEFARQLAPHASVLILVARRGDRLQVLAAELEQAYPSLRVYQCVHDLLLASEREKLALWIQEQNIPLNLLINNAGLGDLGDFLEASWPRLEEIITVNITALTHLTHLLLPALRGQAPSALLQVGSIAGFFSLAGNAVYTASKAYVKSFSEALRVEEQPHGVAVTLLCPGPAPTEFFDVASRPGEKISIASRAPACFITSSDKVVAAALHGLARNRPCIIPNRLLSTVIMMLRYCPVLLFQKRKSQGRNR